ncbi:MAG: cytochrome c [Flavobacteriaceae bacterium]
MIIRLTTVIILVFAMFSCANSNEPELEDVICEDTFTYTDCVKTIISSNCVQCHNSEADPIAPFPLETYTQVKNAVESGNLVHFISLADGTAGAMPPSGRLTQSNIDIISSWADSGFVE